jgi:transposase
VWKSLLNETGSLAPKKRETPWRKIDPVKLKEYIEKNPDAYLREMAEAFNCRIYAVQKALKRLKITRKKKR